MLRNIVIRLLMERLFSILVGGPYVLRTAELDGQTLSLVS